MDLWSLPLSFIFLWTLPLFAYISTFFLLFLLNKLDWRDPICDISSCGFVNPYLSPFRKSLSYVYFILWYPHFHCSSNSSFYFFHSSTGLSIFFYTSSTLHQIDTLRVCHSVFHPIHAFIPVSVSFLYLSLKSTFLRLSLSIIPPFSIFLGNKIWNLKDYGSADSSSNKIISKQ